MSADVDRIPEVAFKQRRLTRRLRNDRLSRASWLGWRLSRPWCALCTGCVATDVCSSMTSSLIACIFLAASTIVLYTVTTDLYLSYSTWLSFLARDFSEVLKRGVSLQKRIFASVSMAWTAIYAVKLSFLFFFRGLVARIRYMTIYWRVVLGATIVAFSLCVCESAFECPHFNAESLHCAFRSGLNRTVTGTAVATVVDFLTDLLIIALPIHLLWKVRIKTRQKFGLGVFLCLSVFMMMTAVVRISALQNTSSFFWQQMEACLAVLMVSLTALRSIFVSDNYRGGGHARARPIRHRMSPADLSRQRFWPSRKKLASSDGADGDAGGLPSIPSATITGLRTFIRGDCADRGGTTPGITMTTTLQSEVYEEKIITASNPAPVTVPEPTESPRRHNHGGEEV
ncbi:MAG: hypothetical protein M1826_000120 [Phylliscum demangeonii]|nr:MAG: hypothetical protein M1826_000120 [Phylliscum demangeonii]